MSWTRPPTSSAIIAGVDEVGRGPLAGPVVAAAVILDASLPIEGLRDSKKLSPAQRRKLSRIIRIQAQSFALGFATVAEIDQYNILEASMLAMARAVARLRIRPSLVRVDGNCAPKFTDPNLSVETVVGGDASIPEISAASIVAKVSRDRLLIRLDRSYPNYGFAHHKGYPTREHLNAINSYGVTEIHRRSFGPVRAALAKTVPEVNS